MKRLILLFVIALVSSSAIADDLADTKKAFATLVEYQKTDDERTPDLFSKDCAITFVFSDGKNEKTAVVPTEVFIESLKKEIARKAGNPNPYEDVKYSPEDSGIRVTANVHYARSGQKGPFSALYRRSADGVLRIHTFKVTVFSKELTTNKQHQ